MHYHLLTSCRPTLVAPLPQSLYKCWHLEPHCGFALRGTCLPLIDNRTGQEMPSTAKIQGRFLYFPISRRNPNVHHSHNQTGAAVTTDLRRVTRTGILVGRMKNE